MMTSTMVRRFAAAAVAAVAVTATFGSGTAIAGKPPTIASPYAGNYVWAGWYGGPWAISINNAGSIRGEYTGPAGLSEMRGSITGAGVFEHWLVRLDGKRVRTVTLGGTVTSDSGGNLSLDYAAFGFMGDVWYRQ